MKYKKPPHNQLPQIKRNKKGKEKKLLAVLVHQGKLKEQSIIWG